MKSEPIFIYQKLARLGSIQAGNNHGVMTVPIPLELRGKYLLGGMIGCWLDLASVTDAAIITVEGRYDFSSGDDISLPRLDTNPIFIFPTPVLMSTSNFIKVEVFLQKVAPINLEFNLAGHLFYSDVARNTIPDVFLR